MKKYDRVCVLYYYNFIYNKILYDATDFHGVVEHDGRFEFMSRKRTDWFAHCEQILKKEIDDFVRYRE